MSTTGKKPARKDKDFGIGNYFDQNDEKKAVLAKNEESDASTSSEIITTKESVQVSEASEPVKKATVKPEKGRGVKKNEGSGSEAGVSSLFVKEKKEKNQAKSVYLSAQNIAFVKRQSEIHDIAFSEVLNRIIDNFRQNY